MIDLHDIRYVRIGSQDLDESVAFATDILGLELVGREGHAAYMRGDDREHNVVYVKGAAAGHVAGFELASSADLSLVAVELEAGGIPVRPGTAEECERRHVRNMVTIQDPSGNVIDLVVGPAASDSRYAPSRDAGITSFSHIGLRATAPKVDEAFWTARMGARVSDRIGDAALLRIDPVHHKIALFPSTFPGIQHVNFQVQSVDDIMRSYYHLKNHNVRIVFGPGRHPTSGARFLYFQGPDGMIYEYSCGVRLIPSEEEATYVPRQFPFAPSSFCMWGSRPDIPEFRSVT